MSRFFGRNYDLQLTTITGEVLTYKPPMEVRFAVDNSPQNTVASARISIYGISARARQLIQRYDTENKRYGTVVLKAGYGDDLGIIFSGQINNVEVTKDGVSTCLRIYCWTPGLEWHTTIFKTWGENTPVIDVLCDVAAAFGSDVEVIGDFSDIPPYPKSFNSGGRLCRDILDSMQASWGYHWRLTPTRAIITRNGAGRDWSSHDITAKNGMEGAPRWYASSMEVDIKLNHQIQPDDVVNVTSSFWTINFSGVYTTDLQGLPDQEKQQQTGHFNVLRTYHEGTLWGDTWKTTLISQWRTQ